MTRSQKVFYMVSQEAGAGLTSVSLGLVRALDREGMRVAFYKPIHQPEATNSSNSLHDSDSNCCDDYEEEKDLQDRSTAFLRATGPFQPPEPFSFHYAEEALHSSENMNRLLESIVEQFEEASHDRNASVIVVEGLTPIKPGIEHLNQRIASALNAQVILVTTLMDRQEDKEDLHTGQHKRNTGGRLYKLQQKMDHAIQVYGEGRLVGCIVNKLNAPTAGVQFATRKSFRMPVRNLSADDLLNQTAVISNDHHYKIRLLGAIPWKRQLLNVRTSDMAKHLGAQVLYRGEMDRRRVDDVCLVARNVSHMVERLRRDTLIITPSDREDILLACCMAENNGVPLAGVILTGGLTGPAKAVLDLCDRTLRETGMPLLLFDNDSYVAAASASNIDREVPLDDIARMERVMDKVASYVDVNVFREELLVDQISKEPEVLSPPAFMHQLTIRARQANRRIVLPEGNDPRVLQAAVRCQERGIAQCILLGDPDEIYSLAKAQGILIMPPGLKIIAPTVELRERYVAPMVELRKHKGITAPTARAQLEDITVLATMMLSVGEVDGLVSGAVHTTANTIRPALQLIKARPEVAIVSSVFFMLLPDQVMIYGDCAINTDPNPKELACIAIESADSAAAFGIDPRVAMLSYSTGKSGTGSDVEKVLQATEIVKQTRPDLLVDGPLQYDAATTKDVARSKAPDSKVAGKANVLIFPDLNTGNTTYKAVQRTANVICVGPMLQGLQRPVNDLSRGALVDDIVYTIALTSIQAEQIDTKQSLKHHR